MAPSSDENVPSMVKEWSLEREWISFLFVGFLFLALSVFTFVCACCAKRKKRKKDEVDDVDRPSSHRESLVQIPPEFSLEMSNKERSSKAKESPAPKKPAQSSVGASLKTEVTKTVPSKLSMGSIIGPAKIRAGDSKKDPPLELLEYVSSDDPAYKSLRELDSGSASKGSEDSLKKMHLHTKEKHDTGGNKAPPPTAKLDPAASKGKSMEKGVIRSKVIPSKRSWMIADGV